MHAHFSDYLHCYSDPRVIKRTIKLISRKLKQANIQFDTIVYTGISGALIAIPLAVSMEKKLCAVRKENSHSPYSLEGELGRRILIIDDQIDSGGTLRKIVNAVNESNKYRGRPAITIAAFFTYKQHSNNYWGESVNEIAQCDHYGCSYDEIEYCVTGQYPPSDRHNRGKIGRKLAQTAMKAAC